MSPGAVSPRSPKAASPRSVATPVPPESLSPTVLAEDTLEETQPADVGEMETDEGTGQAEALQPPAQRWKKGQGWS